MNSQNLQNMGGEENYKRRTAEGVPQRTRKRNKRNKRTNRKKSRKIIVDSRCWGKNKPLEQLWNDLSSFLSVVVIYKGSIPYEIVAMTSNASSIQSQLIAFDADPRVVAILSAHPMSQPGIKNVYETILYPKAKDKTVDYVITNYNHFFKRAPGNPTTKLMVPH
jgi:hypothetical protein